MHVEPARHLRWRAGSRLAAVVVALTLIAVVLGIKLYRDHRRDQEWRHGGDAVRISASVATVSGDEEFKSALTRAGGDPEHFLTGAKQGIVVTVTWDGPPQPRDGRFQFVLLDARVHPPQPISPTGGSSWSSAYNVLAERYRWLAGTAPQLRTDGSYVDLSEALDVTASPSGRAVFAFAMNRHQVPVTDPSTELIVGMFLVEADRDVDDQVRWAKQVPLGQAG